MSRERKKEFFMHYTSKRNLIEIGSYLIIIDMLRQKLLGCEWM
jgi:hypothetical protein